MKLSTPSAALLSLLAGSACAVPAQLLAERPASADLDVEAVSDLAELPMRPPRPLDDDGTFYVLGADPAHPRVRYLDGQVALNESCAVRIGNKLSRKVPPVYVNGQPVGFC